MKSVHAPKSLAVVLFTFLLVATSLLSGCKKDNVDDINTNASLTYPIVDTYQGLTYDNLTQITPPTE